MTAVPVGRRQSESKPPAVTYSAEDRATALKAWRGEHPLGPLEDRRKRYSEFVIRVKGAPPKSRRDAATLHEMAATNDAAGIRAVLLGQASASSGSPGSPGGMVSSPTGGGGNREPRPVDVDERDATGQTALHHAVGFGALEAAAVLLSAGWDPCVEDYKGRLPIDIASEGAYLVRLGKPEESELAELYTSAMTLMLLLFGAQPPAKVAGLGSFFCGKKTGVPTASAICMAWPEGLSDVLVDVKKHWEPKEADLLRHWLRFMEVLPAALQKTKVPAESRGKLRVEAACLLLSLVLGAQLVIEVLPALPGSSEAQDKAADAKTCADVAGIYRYDYTQLNDHLCFKLQDGGPGGDRPSRRAVWQSGRWAIIDAKGNELCVSRDREGPLLGSEWRQISIEAVSEPYRTFSTSSFLPPVHGPGMGRAPFLGLLNPHSGNKMGAPFLDEARNFPSYRPWFFNIVHVATRPAALAAFRRSLEAVKAEALAKGVRPRLISGGGDGTASFAIWVTFKALRAEDEEPAADPAQKQFWRWSDEELRDSFPALVQMPLGTGNDLAGVLGWGRAITPLTDRGHARDWLANAFSLSRIVVPFDVWGLHTLGTSGLKVCNLAGLDKKHSDRPRFQCSGPSVPFLCLLYFSMGYEAFIASQVELNRQDSRLKNFLEYGKAIPATMLGSMRRNIDLSGMRITVPPAPEKGKKDGKDKPQQYFPPEARGSTGSEYATVGCMNINSIGGGLWSATDAAKFGDGLIDLFRQRSYFGNVLRRGRTYDTEKHSLATFHLPAELPGVHMQFDGEARFLFHPEQEAASFDLCRVMQLPAVLGPETLEIPMGDAAGWKIAADRDSPGADAAFIPATDLEECKALCIKHGFGGFCIFKRRAFFREENPDILRTRLTQRLGATFYIRDETAQDVRFAFTSPGEQGSRQFQQTLSDWVQGKFTPQVNATQGQVDDLQHKSDNYSQGICDRAARAYVDFKFSKVQQYGDGAMITTALTPCATCSARAGSWGCQGCRRPFCKNCFTKHRGSAPSVQWGYNDVSNLRKNLQMSAELCLRDAQDQLKKLQGSAASRPIRLLIISRANEEGNQEEETTENAQDAASWLKSYEEGDMQKFAQPRSLVTFHNTFKGRGGSDVGTVFGMGGQGSERIEEEVEEGEDPLSEDAGSLASCERLENFLSEEEGPSEDTSGSRPSKSCLKQTPVDIANARRDSLTKSWQKEGHASWKPLPVELPVEGDPREQDAPGIDDQAELPSGPSFGYIRSGDPD